MNDDIYKTTYNFEKNGVSYEAVFSGLIFDKTDDVEYFHISELNKEVRDEIAYAVTFSIMPNGQNIFFLDNISLLESNANSAYAVLIEGDLYPITLHVNIRVLNPFSLLTKTKN